MATEIKKGFIKDWLDNTILPITRGELVLDKEGNMALASSLFLAGEQKDADGNILKDAQGNPLPGLITAAERAMLSGGNAGGIGGIYTELGHINNGLYFNGTKLSFYKADKTATPIKLVSDGNVVITPNTSTNEVNFTLKELTTGVTSVTSILKSITVDKYGRVTAVSGSALTNNDLPETITRPIANSTLTGCTTPEKTIADNDLAIVNKAYVDAKFSQITGASLGALIFGGPLSTTDSASTALGNSANVNKYYKVVGEIVISKSDLYDDYGVVGSTITAKLGDTLIIAKRNDVNKFVYVPSGDDEPTSISVTTTTDSTYPYDSKVGDVVLRFSDLFTVSTPSDASKIADIELKPVSDTSDGYLTKEDYVKFLSSSAKSITFTPNASLPNLNKYEIGKLTFDTTETSLFGINSVSSLTLVPAANNINPSLKFTETGQADVSITLKGGNGISVTNSGNEVTFTAGNTVKDNSKKYLEITSGYQFEVKTGKVTSDGTTSTVVPGLTDYEEFNNFRLLVASTNLKFDIISDSLYDTTKSFHYGSTSLKGAVTTTI